MRQKILTLLHTLSLCALPAAFVVLILASRTGPDGTSFFMDPDWIYVFNGLLLATGEYAHVMQHPGTPVALLSALFVKIKWLVFPEDSANIITDVLAHFGHYHSFVGNGILSINTLSLFIFGWYFLKKKIPIYAILLAQFSIFWFSQIILFSGRGLPEGLGLTLGLLLGALWARTVISEKNPGPILFGGSLGVACAVKFNYLPYSLLFLAIQKIKRIPLYLIGAIAGFYLSVQFISPEMRDTLWKYLVLLTLRKGLWGTGPQEVPSISDLVGNFYSFWNEDPVVTKVFFALLLFSASVFSFSLFYKLKEWRQICAFFLVNLFIFLATLKHPSVRYLYPAFVLFPSIIIVLFVLKIPAWLKWAPVLALSLFFYSEFHEHKAQIYNFILAKKNLGEEDRALNAILKQNVECPVVGSPDSSFIGSAMVFGSVFSHDKFIPTLAELYPHHWVHSGIHSNTVVERDTFMTGFIPVRRLFLGPFRRYIEKYKCLIFIGRRDDPKPKHIMLFPELKWKELYGKGTTTVSKAVW